jgi:hypothetical protein
MISIKIAVKVEGLKRYEESIRQDMAGTGNGPLRQAMDKWPEIFMDYTQTRFMLFSMGGGNWPPLAAATVRKKKHSTILIDSGVLRDSLNPAHKSHRTVKRIPGGVKITQTGGYRRHPGTKSNSRPGGISIGRLAEIHHGGDGHVPPRPIFADPDPATMQKIQRTIEDALKQLGREHGV